MLQSKLFTKPRKEAPKDEVSKNAVLLVRGGFVDKLHSGVYSFLPLGLMVLRKVDDIIRDEVKKAGAEEVLMPALHPKEIWQKTGRWETLDVLYKFKDVSDKDVALGPTHEEVVVPLVKQFVNSYKDLPFSVFQFQDKFRKELRAKSGILRTREFVMKDMYSFHANETDLKEFYEKMKIVYRKIFERIGIGSKTHLTFASGGSFSQFSHEFQTEIDAGEDIIYVCPKCDVAVNNEIIGVQPTCPECGSSQLRSTKAIEVGNIFELKAKFSEPFGLTYKDEQGTNKLVQMGCYGIAPSRSMGTVVELFGSENSIVWPESISPFRVHLISLAGAGDEGREVLRVTNEIYTDLERKGVSVLYDDRDARAGEKFADADLIGIPHRIIVSEKLVKANQYEYKDRSADAEKIVSKSELLAMF